MLDGCGTEGRSKGRERASFEYSSEWRSSPVHFSLEPTPEYKKPRILHTRIDFYDGTASLDLAYEVAEEFGLDPGKARNIAKEVATAVKDWDKEAIRFGAGKDEVERIRSAFDHGDLHQALKGMAWAFRRTRSPSCRLYERKLACKPYGLEAEPEARAG